MGFQFTGPALNIAARLGAYVIKRVKGRLELGEAVMENKKRLASSENECNNPWELKRLQGAGWQDDLLFYAWLAFFVWSGFSPEQAAGIMDSWESLPGWFSQTTFWIVAAVLGLKKAGDYLPGVAEGLRKMVKGQ